MKTRKELHKELSSFWKEAPEYEKNSHFRSFITTPHRDIIMKLAQSNVTNMEEAALYVDVFFKIMKKERCGRVLYDNP